MNSGASVLFSSISGELEMASVVLLNEGGLYFDRVRLIVLVCVDEDSSTLESDVVVILFLDPFKLNLELEEIVELSSA